MITSLEVLVEQAASETPTVQDEAILQLAMLLEFNRLAPSSKAAKRAEYEELVPAERLVDLDESTEREILSGLAAIARSRRFKPSLLWAIGKGKPRLACHEVADLIAELSTRFDTEATWQAVAALDQCYAPHIDAVAGCLRQEVVIRFLESVGAADDADARETATKLLRRMKHDLGV